MPRKSADRAFGFRGPGLARILVAADPDEVLRALLLLGIDPTSEAAFKNLTDAVLAHLTAPVVAALRLFDDAVELIDDIVNLGIARLPTDLAHIGALRQAGRLASGHVLTTKAEIDALQIAFQERMDDAEADWPQFVWPATPGIFEEA